MKRSSMPRQPEDGHDPSQSLTGSKPRQPPTQRAARNMQYKPLLVGGPSGRSMQIFLQRP